MQLGSLDREKRKRLDVWTLRWWETDPATGSRKHRRKVIGTIEQYPTRTSVGLAVRTIRTEILCNGWLKQATQMTIATLADDYVRQELSEENDRLSASTKYGCMCRLRKWILPRWQQYKLPDIKAVEFQHWLRTLPLSNETRRSLKNTMSVLFSHACRYGFYSQNPMRWVRQGGQRRRLPFRFDVDDVKNILAELDGMPKLCVLLDYGLGLRQGELFGLKWGDIEWKRQWISVVRSIVNGRVGLCKTEASKRMLPLDPRLIAELTAWRTQTPYAANEDWIFADPGKEGALPYSGQYVFRKYVLPAVRRTGFRHPVGWHAFRHTMATLLDDCHATMAQSRDMLRHASIRSTYDFYMAALTEAKRQVQAKLLSLLMEETDA